MKKIFNSAIWLLFICIVLSSCSKLSDVSIVKRHYKKGYYVSMGEKKHREIKMQETKKIQTKPENINIIPEKNPAGLASGTISMHKNNAIDRGFSKNNSSYTDNKTRETGTKLLAPVKKIIKTSEDNNRSILANKKNSNNALFWTIVLVLLLLWALFYFTDIWVIGGIINLLLVIAIVLIILRILDII